MSATTKIMLKTRPYREVNDEIRRRFKEGAETLELAEVYGQRYVGCAMPAGCRLEIYGTPGNDMGAYMDGGSIEVFGNGQDQIANTMNDGNVVIHGHCGDAAGYAMRGGEIFIRDYCGWRVGIHMKEYEEKCPTIVIGGDAGSFLGEYMAGGTIVCLGKPSRYLGTGMHGGVMYLKEGIEIDELSEGLVQKDCDAADISRIEALLARYNEYFAADGVKVAVCGTGFKKIVPASSRPYGNMYVRD